MNYRWDAGALVDLEQSTVFYFKIDPLLELRFSDCIDRAIEQITNDPNAWPFLVGDVRRFVVDTFPFSVLYSIEPSHILILAVAHHSRDPEYWKVRLK